MFWIANFGQKWTKYFLKKIRFLLYVQDTITAFKFTVIDTELKVYNTLLLIINIKILNTISVFKFFFFRIKFKYFKFN